MFICIHMFMNKLCCLAKINMNKQGAVITTGLLTCLYDLLFCLMVCFEHTPVRTLV